MKYTAIINSSVVRGIEADLESTTLEEAIKEAVSSFNRHPELVIIDENKEVVYCHKTDKKKTTK